MTRRTAGLHWDYGYPSTTQKTRTYPTDTALARFASNGSSAPRGREAVEGDPST